MRLTLKEQNPIQALTLKQPKGTFKTSTSRKSGLTKMLKILSKYTSQGNGAKKRRRVKRRRRKRVMIVKVRRNQRPERRNPERRNKI